MSRSKTIFAAPCALAVLLIGVCLQAGAQVDDFAQRCTAPGVVKCVSFDTEADIAGRWGSVSGIVPGAGQAPAIDTTVKASGKGSLKFTIPGNAGNVAGSYFTNFSDDLKTQFGAGEEFYVQWRQRISPEFLSTSFSRDGTGGWKQAIIGEGDRAGVCNPASPTSATCTTSCSQLDIAAQSREGGPNLPSGYHSCGGKDGGYDPFEFRDSATSILTFQNAVGCTDSNRLLDSPCVKYRSGQWMTWQMRVKIGNWYRNDRNYRQDSTVQMWVAEEGQPSKLVIDFRPGVHGIDLANDNPLTAKYGKVWLLPYQNRKSASVAHPTANMWFDELIISRNRIPDPSPTQTADSDSPIVSMATPAQGATVSGDAVKVSAVAADNLGVKGVQFVVDGSNWGAEVGAPPYAVTFDSRLLSNGNHTLSAVARDAAGNFTRAAPVNVVVDNASSASASKALVSAAATAVAAATVVPTLSLTPLKTGLELPIGITNAKDGSNRLFLNLQRGQVVIWDGSKILPTPFLDIRTLVSCCGEQGLLGVAFHPKFSTNGYFYVNYTDKTTPSSNTVVARYKVSTTDPNRADPASALILLTQSQPYSNHNGGQMRFGPDGYLYISMGDGGSGGDPENRSQNPETLLGKMLRIDVDRQDPGKNYAIPTTNPYVNTNPFPGKTPRKEIWAYGLRNAWAFSFDRQTGDLYMGDVGQNAWEEIDFQPASSVGGENYGWRLMEGTSCFNPTTNCNNGTLTLPILTYDHGLGCSVTGGYVYRGAQFGGLFGTYLYGDVCSGRIWGAVKNGGTWATTQLLDTTLSVVAWGEDESGELYLLDRGGEGSANGGFYRVLSTPTGEIVVDNAALGVKDANRTFTGTWCKSVGTGQVGADSLSSCGTGVDTYRWMPTIVNAGYYDVYVRWTTAPIRSTVVPYVVAHADGATSKTFNQQTNGGQWVLHGTYRFLAGTTGYVESSDPNGVANSDAIRLLPGVAPVPATLRVGVAGDGSGRVTTVPAGIDCGADCNEDYPVNTAVNVTATPDPGSAFFEWGGPCAGNGACTITMNDSKFLAATFRSAGIVVDNAAPGVQDSVGGRTFTGLWCASAGTQFYGTGSIYGCGSGRDTYRWTPKVPTTGSYDVYIRWSASAVRSPSVPVTVVHATGTETKTFNQQVNGGKWVLVGRYTFTSGTTGYIQMTKEPGAMALADAIEIVPVQ